MKTKLSRPADAPRPTLRERGAALKASAARVMRGSREPAQASPAAPALDQVAPAAPDPVFRTIAAHQEADARMDALQRRISGQRATRGDLDEEDRLGEAQCVTAERLLKAVPRTVEGLQAYAGELRRYVAARDEGDGHAAPEIIQQAFDALATSVGALSPRTEAPAPDLSRFTIGELAGLFDTYERAAGLYAVSGFWPKIGEAGSGLLSEEVDRCEAMMEAIGTELKRRVPADASDSDEKAERLARLLLRGGDWKGARAVAAQAEAAGGRGAGGTIRPRHRQPAHRRPRPLGRGSGPRGRGRCGALAGRAGGRRLADRLVPWR
ncbi:hypothetical protein [Methylobacterium sp. WSM2598]|uniref:hypothetical protein n=1 Tax=Methylobacterium sp. WSM2598 TaxID=398261 RepID=UPI00037BD972|nr:hypothetical protein [Methylobacterium sp. WSM2598]